MLRKNREQRTVNAQKAQILHKSLESYADVSKLKSFGSK